MKILIIIGQCNLHRKLDYKFKFLCLYHTVRKVGILYYLLHQNQLGKGIFLFLLSCSRFLFPNSPEKLHICPRTIREYCFLILSLDMILCNFVSLYSVLEFRSPRCTHTVTFTIKFNIKEFSNYNSLPRERFLRLVKPENISSLKWLIRKLIVHWIKVIFKNKINKSKEGF